MVLGPIKLIQPKSAWDIDPAAPDALFTDFDPGGVASSNIGWTGDGGFTTGPFAPAADRGWAPAGGDVGEAGASALAGESLSTSSATAQLGPASTTQTVRLAGSGLVFVNTYTSNVSQQYVNAIISAENFFQQTI